MLRRPLTRSSMPSLFWSSSLSVAASIPWPTTTDTKNNTPIAAFISENNSSVNGLDMYHTRSQNGKFWQDKNLRYYFAHSILSGQNGHKLPFWPLRSIWGVWKWSHWISHAQKHGDKHQNQVSTMFKTKQDLVILAYFSFFFFFFFFLG